MPGGGLCLFHHQICRGSETLWNRLRPNPDIDILFVNHDGHPVMDFTEFRDGIFRKNGKDRVMKPRVAFFDSIEAGKPDCTGSGGLNDIFISGPTSPSGLDMAPFEIVGGGDNASPSLPGFPESDFVPGAFYPCVD